MSENNALIPAATILLLRDTPVLQVLMVERHKGISFAGGALVFPGGRIDHEDHSVAWTSFSSGISSDPAIAAGQVASIREAFEETGVLFVRRRGEAALLGADDAAALQDWRAKSENDARNFRKLIEQENLLLACDALQLFAHWSPPKGVGHKRFDTLFFAAIAPTGQAIRQDGVEATEALWISPEQALKDGKNGDRKIIFPTARNLELLAKSSKSDDVMRYARERPIRRIEPQMVERDGACFLTIPTDLGYPITEEPLESAMRA